MSIKFNLVIAFAAMILLTHKGILRICPTRKSNNFINPGVFFAAGKDLKVRKTIAIDTREINWEEGYNEKLGRMLYS